MADSDLGESMLSASDPPSEDNPEIKIINIDSNDADEVFAALSSATARRLLLLLHDTPMTSSSVANHADTSLQNAQYHLKNLEEAGLIDIVDVRYSEKGREMNVYGPADASLVLFAGQEREATDLKRLLAGFLGTVALLGIVTLIVQRLLHSTIRIVVSSGTGGRSQSVGASGAGGIPLWTTQPIGILFFAGGIVALLIGFLIWFLWNSRQTVRHISK